MSANFAGVRAAGSGPSGISVDGLPPLPDPDALQTHAQSLAASGNDVHSGVNDAARTWAALAGAYEAPEAGQVLAGFNPVFARSQDLANMTGKAATVLAAYADRARELKQRINTLRAEVRALDEVIGGNDDWRSNLSIVDRHRETMDKASALAQAILDSDASCATELSGLTGGQRYSAPAIPRATLNGSTDMVANALTHAQHFFGNDEKLPELPWGPPNISVRLGGAGSAGQGFLGTLIGAGQGLYTLLGTTDKAKQLQAWQGMFALGAAAFTTKAVIDRGFKDATTEDINAVLTTAGVVKETIHYDEWGTDPAYAIGATTFDVASMFVGGTGAGLKAGSTAGRLGLAAERLSAATMDSPRLEGLSSALGNAANGLHRTGLFLDKPGSLALKLSDLVMPSTTAKILNEITQTKAASWAALDNAKTVAADLVSGGKHLAADGMNHLARSLRNADASLPTAFHPDPGGLLARTADNTALPNWLEKSAAGIRENTPQTQGGSGARAENLSSPPHTPVVPDPFPPQNNITNTVLLQHGHDFFPVSRKDNFAAKTGLEPNTLYIVDNRTKIPDSSGGLTADSLERFYTDATGRVERVDTYAGVKGAWSVELNKRMPNVTYNVVAKTDGGLENHFTIITDDFAKPKSVEAHITGLLKGDINRSAWQQILAGRRVGGFGYDGGHLIASLFAGPGEGANLLAQLMFQNRGHGTPNVSANTLAFFQLERELMTKALHRVDRATPRLTPKGRSRTRTKTRASRPGGRYLPVRFGDVNDSPFSEFTREAEGDILSSGEIISRSSVQAGLNRLRRETFREGALGFGAQEVVSTSVFHQAWSQQTEAILRDGVWGPRSFSLEFSRESMIDWLQEIRRESYVPGIGTWTSCKVYLYPDSEGRLEIFDTELLRPAHETTIPDRPADALTLFQDLKAFPRTLDNIPPWMWTVFRAEGVTPPIYNPQLKTVEWANKRLPVTENGTDFSVEPEIIDPSKEPGFFAKIGRKLFGG